MGEPYSKTWKKGLLIQKVRVVGEKQTTTLVQPLSETQLPLVTREI